MDLVDEKNITFLQICEKRGYIASLLDRWTGSGPEFGPHFVGYYMSERGFSQTRWTSQEYVIESLAPPKGGLHVYSQVFFYLALADVFGNACRAQRKFKQTFLVVDRFTLHRRRLWFSRHLQIHPLASLRRLPRKTDSTVTSSSSATTARSEERRVGKECRSRWSP